MTDWAEPLIRAKSDLDKLLHALNEGRYIEAQALTLNITVATCEISRYLATQQIQKGSVKCHSCRISDTVPNETRESHAQ